MNRSAPAVTLAPANAFTVARDLAAADMARVDAMIRQRLHSDVVLINAIGEHIVGGGGKRLRPTLHVLAARAAGYTGDAHVGCGKVARQDEGVGEVRGQGGQGVIHGHGCCGKCRFRLAIIVRRSKLPAHAYKSSWKRPAAVAWYW